MIRLVLDTNVVVSALMTPLGSPGKVLDLVFNGDVTMYYSCDILIEYENVMSRPALKITPEKSTNFHKVLSKVGVLVEPAISNIHLPDESDRIFYDTARESFSILVTGNIRHYPLEEFIMTPSEFLSSLNIE
jgi:putative PIN family toxin of toxin-antitoxin system